MKCCLESIQKLNVIATKQQCYNVFINLHYYEPVLMDLLAHIFENFISSLSPSSGSLQSVQDGANERYKISIVMLA